MQLKIFLKSVLIVPWFEAAGLVEGAGGVFVAKMSNGGGFHAGGGHFVHAVEEYGPAKTTAPVIFVRANGFEESGGVQMIVRDDGEGHEGAIWSQDEQLSLGVVARGLHNSLIRLGGPAGAEGGVVDLGQGGGIFDAVSRPE